MASRDLSVPGTDAQSQLAQPLRKANLAQIPTHVVRLRRNDALTFHRLLDVERHVS